MDPNFERVFGKEAMRLWLFATMLLAVGAAGADAVPVGQRLLSAGEIHEEWLLPAKSYFGNRLSGLTQITPENVHGLALAWRTQISDDGQQEAAPIVSNGTMYIATPHDNVLALDARTGKLKWQFPYNPRCFRLP